MKLRIILIVIICSIGYYSYCQSYIIHVKTTDSKTWKYANINGDIVIDCNYPVSYQFSEDGIAAEYYPKKNLYYLIDTKGKVINTEINGFLLKDAFGYGAKGYYGGLVVIRIKKKWGCLDTAGKIAIPIKYDHLTEFNNGHGIGKIGYNYYLLSKNGKEKLIEEQGVKDIKHFEEYLAPYIAKNNKKGFIDTNGNVAISPQFIEVGYFSDGLAWAESEGSIGFINNKGEWVIKPQFDAAKRFDAESGLAMAKYKGKWVYVNKKGDIISFDISDTIDDFFGGLAKGKKNNLVGFYNNKGEWVIQPQFEGARDFKNGFAAAKSDGLWGIIDKEGKWIIKPKFANIRDVVKIKQ